MFIFKEKLNSTVESQLKAVVIAKNEMHSDYHDNSLVS